MIPNWSAPLKLQDAAGATGNGANLSLAQLGGVSLAISGTFVGTVTFEVSMDGGTTWFGITMLNRTTGLFVATATAPGIFSCALPGIPLIRARVSAYTSGAITVTGIAFLVTTVPAA